MKYYVLDSVGFEVGVFATFADAYECMENDFDPECWITTNENPWK